MGWLWTHIPEPPVHRIQQTKAERKLSVSASGIDQRYVAAGLAYLRDEDTILDRRKERKPGGKRKGDSKGGEA